MRDKHIIVLFSLVDILESRFIIIRLSLFLLPLFNRPMVLGLYLVVLSFFAGFRVRVGRTPWFFFLMVLVFTGGIIVIRLYIFSFSSLFKVRHMEGILVLFSFLFIGLFYLGQDLAQVKIQGLVDFEGGEIITFILFYLLFVISMVIDLVLKIKGSFQG